MVSVIAPIKSQRLPDSAKAGDICPICPTDKHGVIFHAHGAPYETEDHLACSLSEFHAREFTAAELESHTKGERI